MHTQLEAITVEILTFALLGLGTGAVYALLAQGLVVIYRGSGLLNFAQGGFAMVGAYAYYEAVVRHGLPRVVGLLVALVVCAALGAAVQLLVLRPMRRASALSMVIATLGVLIVLQSVAFLVYGHNPLPVPGLLPTHPVHLGSNRLVIGSDRIYLFVIGLLLTAVLYVVYRFTSFGRTTTAVAENQLTAASLGHSPTVIASINWAVGAALAGLAGVLISPIIFLEPTSLVLLVLPAMAAALIGEFSSFPLTLLVALLLGSVESLIQRYVSQPGWATAAPFVVVIALLVARGTNLPLRSVVLERLPAVGSGRVHPVPMVVGYVILSWLLLTKASPDWSAAATFTAGTAIVGLSIVVITGYAGQLSLAQAVLAGVGALLAARFVAHMPFLLALLAAAFCTAAIGGLVGIPALRTRGMTLAIATLGLGGALSAVVLSNPKYTGGVNGITVPVPHVFGWSIDPFFRAGRYAFVTVTLLLLLGFAVANLRRGVTGRQLLAVRSNERAAASLGINNALVKVYAFALGSGIAAIGGVLIAFSQSTVEVSQGNSFTVFACILLVSVVVAGGVGSAAGAFIGSLLVAGGVVSQLFSKWSSINDYLALIGGAALLAVLILAPDGLAELTRQSTVRLAEPVMRRLRPMLARRRRPAAAALDEQSPDIRVTPLVLDVRGLSVSFGGIKALHDVALQVRPGEIHGLIGPNGAGKTTLIDAITGFARPQQGTVTLGGQDLSRLPARLRATAGLARSFQSLELFSDLTVAENLAVASEHGHRVRYLADLIFPRRLRLSPVAREVLRDFDLTELAHRKPDSISFGHRKTVAIARSVAAVPSVLLLDEPAAGLDDHEADELADLIRKLAKQWGIGVLLVEHKIDMIMSLSDRVTVLNNGEVLMSGTPHEVSTHPAVLDAYLGTTELVS